MSVHEEHKRLRALLQRLGSTYSYTEDLLSDADRVYQPVRIVISSTPAAPRQPRAVSEPKADAVPAAPAGPSALAFATQAQPNAPLADFRPAPIATPPEPAADMPFVPPSMLKLSGPVPVPELTAAELLIEELEDRGHRVMSRNGKVLISNSSKLTDDDRQRVRALYDDVLKHALPVPQPQTSSMLTFLGNDVPVDAGRTDWRPPTPPSLAGIDSIELDTETTGLRWWAGDLPIGISIRLPDGRSYYLPWGHAGGNLDEAVVKEWARRELRGKHLTGANIKFDIHMLRAWGVDLEEQGCTVGDVQIYAALLDDNRKKFNLDLLSRDFLNREKLDAAARSLLHDLDKTRMASYHAGEVAPYAEMDVILTGDLKQVMLPMLRAQNLQKVQLLEESVIFPVCEMEKNGAPIDVELLNRWVKESETELSSCLWEIHRQTGMSINPDASADLERLFHHLKIPVVYLKKTGAPSFTDAIMKRIDNPIIKLVRRAAKISDLRSRYLIKYQRTVGADGILRYALHQTRYQRDDGVEGGVGPGRFSSSELADGVGCNIQQVMKITKQRKTFGYHEDDDTHDDEIRLIRKLVIPDQSAVGEEYRGRVQWLCADLMQVEYRLFAHYAENPRVIEEYKRNPLASFHVMLHEMVREEQPDIVYDEQKNLNFAVIYGAKMVKQAVMLGFITEQEAEEIRDNKDWDSPKLARMATISRIYNKTLPEAAPLLDKASKLAQDRGFVMTYLGRRSRFDIDHRYHKALNNVLQGGGADYNKVKLVEVHKERKTTGFLMRFSVHDELDGDAREPDTLKKVESILNHQSWPDLKIPLLWEIGVGPNWAEAKG
jgi:DNA polymerase I